MRLPPSLISALLVCLVACGKNEKECKTDAEALGKLLRETPHEPEMFLVTGRHLVTRQDRVSCDDDVGRGEQEARATAARREARRAVTTATN